MTSTSKKLLLWATFFLAGAVQSFGQTESLTILQQQFDNYSKHALQEKVFVHTDRSTYLAGESIWFKVYCTDGSSHKPLALSKVAYLEILDKDKTPVLQTKIELKDGSGKGAFFVPASVGAGSYQLRAYTNWMKNTGPDYFFEKTISIVNTFQRLGLVAQEDALYDVQFFPEGGHLVYGLPSKVAFKVTDAQGKGIDFKGYILDQQKDTVASFAPLTLGMGHFSFTPQENKVYKAVLIGPGEKVLTQALPPIQPAGMVMHLEEQGTRLKIHVRAKHLKLTEDIPMVYLLAHTRQVSKVAQARVLNQGEAVFTIDKEALGEGISHLTLFDHERKPVCERLYFRRPQQLLHIKASADQSHYAPRAKVSTTLLSTDLSGKEVAADMSVSVYRLDSLQGEEASGIYHYLWLSSDLRGYIESPEYYFAQDNPQVNEAIDNLMLTHGWRRFQWEVVLNHARPAPAFVAELNGPVLQGKVLNKQNGLTAAGVSMYLATPGKRTRLYSASSNAEGLVNFELDDVYGSQDLILQPAAPKDSIYRYELVSSFAANYSAYRLPAFKLSKSLKDELQAQSLHLQVQNAHYGSYLTRLQAPRVDSMPFFGVADYRYNLDDFNRFRVMEEVLREYVLPVAVRKRKGKFILRVLDQAEKIFYDDPLILLDGVPVPDADMIMAYDPLKVKSIEVVAGMYYLGSKIFSGMINFSTYNGDLPDFQLDPSSLVIEHESLQLQREFYAPRYDTPQQKASRLPDLRNLLYWSPEVKTGPDGKKQITFFTSDQQGKFLFVVHGLSSEGLAGSSSFVFEVHESL